MPPASTAPATTALRVPTLARELGLGHVELTTDLDNEPSQKVILANGGVPLGAFDKGAVYGHSPGLRFRIDLQPGA